MHRLLLACVVLTISYATVNAQAPPRIPGLLRKDQASIQTARERGLVLLGELNCTACHRLPEQAETVDAKRAPDLSSVGARVDPNYLERFILNPTTTKPGSTMPHVLVGSQAAANARSLTHFLVSLTSDNFERTAPDAVAAKKGRDLFHQVSCVACHSPRDAEGRELSPEDSAPLGQLEKKYSVASLTAFIENPQHTRPSGRMPKTDLEPAEAHQIANYLLRATRVPGALNYTLYRDELTEDKAQQSGIAEGFTLEGFESYQRDFAIVFEGYLSTAVAGQYEFFLSASHAATLDLAGETPIDAKENRPANAKISLKAGLTKIRLSFVHRSGTPSLELQMAGPGIERGPLKPGTLRAHREAIASPPRFQLNKELAARGAKLFDKLSCNNCHALEPTAAKKSKIRDATKGCLSSQSGSWPAYSLSAGQIADIRTALASDRNDSSAESRIRQRLTALNCLACHERGEIGGVPASRNDYYESFDQHIGETGRLPPPLTGVGAKLQPEWLRDTISSGRRIRPYLSMRMPAFGKDNGQEIAGLFAARDRVPEVAFDPPPRNRDKKRDMRNMGHSLIGNKGFSCISCHTFRNRKTGTMGAIDIADSTTKRLNKDWFYHYMLDPVRFRSNTVMPQYFPEGASILKDFAKGDAKAQLDAIWYYLSDGRNAREPSGMRRESMEIVVGDEAVMLRRNAQDTGKRGISVGYPRGVHLTFDAESVSLNQLWRGQFLDPGGVWRGQGSGAARIMARERLRLGRGASLAHLEKPSSPWPTRTGRELGIRFKGYQLDKVRRPTFLYVFRDIAVRDRPLPIEKAEKVYFERRLSFESTTDADALFFRIVSSKNLEQIDDTSIRVDDKYLIRSDASITIRNSTLLDGAKDATTPVTWDGRSGSLSLEYHWLEPKR